MSSNRLQLVFFADDWGRHPSSAQHLARELADHYDILWVETIGTRAPKIDRYTWRRGLEKVQGWVRGRRSSVGEKAPVTVVSPFMLPWFGSFFSRKVNGILLVSALSKLVKPDSVLVTTLPTTADVVKRLPSKKKIYYMVDDFSQWPGLEGATLARMEMDLVQSVDEVVVVSEVLKERVRQWGREARLVSHGVDPGFWMQNGSSQILPNDQKRPFLVFWGLVDQRLDVDFLKNLTQKLECTVFLVGPEQDVDPEVAKMSRVVRLGPVSFDALPGIAKSADVLILPYRDLEVTRAMQPLKLKEYLVCGKPIVARDLPSTRPYRENLWLANSAEEFVRGVEQALLVSKGAHTPRPAFNLQGHSWKDKARELSESWQG